MALVASSLVGILENTETVFSGILAQTLVELYIVMYYVVEVRTNSYHVKYKTCLTLLVARTGWCSLHCYKCVSLTDVETKSTTQDTSASPLAELFVSITMKI